MGSIMKATYYSIFFCLIVMLAGCKSAQRTSAVQTSKYSEDLSLLRPRLESPVDTTSVSTVPQKKPYIEATHTINKPLETVLDSINRFHLSRKFIDGFSIQVYSGHDRMEALNIRKGLTTALPDLSSEVQYNPPNFRVKTGKYFTRLEAQKDYVAVKKYFPSAIVIPDKIELN